ncbi:hypothetical protein D3C86_596680 [compost metagenome]
MRSHPLIPVLAAGLLLGCSVGDPLSNPETTMLSGLVESFGSPRQIAATLEEVGAGSTVSLIEPASGHTLATTVTTDQGRFILTFEKTFKPSVGPYFLEAVKGLSVGGKQNRPGSPSARVRTLISFQKGRWLSLTGGSINITRGTTALAVLSSFKAFDSTKNLDLMSSLALGQSATSAEGLTSTETFVPPNAWVSLEPHERIDTLEYHRAWSLVDRSLSLDADPIAALFPRVPGATASPEVPLPDTFPGIAMGQDGFAATSVKPATASATAPSVLKVWGIGLGTSTGSIKVTLGGATCSVLTASPTGTEFTLRVPAGLAASTYPLVISLGPWTHQSLTVQVQ